MSKTVIQSLWIGGRLSQLERLAIRSFLYHHHEYHLYAYRQVEGVPPGTVVKDASEIIPESEIFTYRNGSFAAFSNWFRYCLIARTGHFWVDTDVVCLAPFEFEERTIFGLQEPGVVNSAVLRFPPGDPIVRTMERLCDKPNTLLRTDDLRRMLRKLKRRFLRGNQRSNIEWGEYGPKGLTSVLNHRGLIAQAKPAHYFYPVYHGDWRSLFEDPSPRSLDALKGSYAIHLWNEMLRRDGVDKDAAFPTDSLIEQLKRTYL